MVERLRGEALRGPADALKIDRCVCRRQVGDRRQMNAGRLRYLREVHGAELAGADKSDAKRPAFGRAFLQSDVEAHALTLDSSGEARVAGSLRRSAFPRQRNVVILQQAIVRQALDRCEISVGNVFGTLEPADVVGHRAKAQVDADSIPGR